MISGKGLESVRKFTKKVRYKVTVLLGGMVCSRENGTLEVFSNEMCHINLRFTYLLTVLNLNYGSAVIALGIISFQ